MNLSFLLLCPSPLLLKTKSLFWLWPIRLDAEAEHLAWMEGLRAIQIATIKDPSLDSIRSKKNCVNAQRRRMRMNPKRENRETEKQRNRETEKQRNRETEKQRNRETELQDTFDNKRKKHESPIEKQESRLSRAEIAKEMNESWTDGIRNWCDSYVIRESDNLIAKEEKET